MMLREGPPSIRFIVFLVYISTSAVFLYTTYVTYCDATKLLSHDCTSHPKALPSHLEPPVLWT